MNTETLPEKERMQMQEQLEILCSDDGLKRRDARKILVKEGISVLPYVMELLDSKKHICRWEAMKVMVEIGSPNSIPIFLESLSDESGDIRWIASEGLIHTGKYSVKPLLELILDEHDSVFVLNGAHHVFSVLNTKKLLPKDFPTKELLNMLRVTGNPSSLKVLVHQTLNTIKLEEE